MARCKKNKWKTSETTNFYSGETAFGVRSPEKCKAKKTKKK